MVVTFFASHRGAGGSSFGVDAHTKGHTACVEGVMVREFTIAFNAFLDMDAGIHTWADVVNNRTC